MNNKKTKSYQLLVFLIAKNNQIYSVNSLTTAYFYVSYLYKFIRFDIQSKNKYKRQEWIG
ncbi:hypothetical protein B5800_12220 [Gilliamella apicola]|nr:hypothetical protein B5800_12220 [Gilliamella apicola]ORF48665.1 hypothetical protein B5799_07620 [Gilliamella apicola]ORF53339.1 hypothetical protein B5798_09645 [Gilliamella apicola]ORF55010.1 hypothetical protein B5802_07470 [Gilliamella apicola]ORF60111.1 hypothetical protein B5804_08890 [Gilliamella apicola]